MTTSTQTVEMNKVVARPELRVAFSLATGGEAFLELLDVSGRRIERRAVGGLGAGPHVVPLAEGRRLPPGLYLIRLVEGGQAATVRTVVAR